MNVRQSPRLAADIIIQMNGSPASIVLVKRKFPPEGWAIPGGFVEYGESVEEAAVREAWEETSLRVKLLRQFHVYSDPGRDPRGHTITIVFLASAEGTPIAQDDAADVRIVQKEKLPFPLAFDHQRILTDYFNDCY
jgi:ADP-ribose pyrophosphatase YjhB (NUDIX family)